MPPQANDWRIDPSPNPLPVNTGERAQAACPPVPDDAEPVLGLAEGETRGSIRAVARAGLAVAIHGESVFHLRVNTSVALESAIGGTFRGSLAQVVARLLEGHHDFIRRQAGEIEVTVIGLKGDRAIAAARPRPAAGYGLAQQAGTLTNNVDVRKR